MSELSTTEPCALLTVRDVAAWLRVHPKTVYAWAARQAIPTVKIQGTLRFRREDLTAFVEACLVKEPNRLAAHTRLCQSHQPDIPAVVARAKRLVQASSTN
jgi:excisionase family DNA binding protein